jgi:5-(carboxyamino)imidazole ribonucleotide mutase
MQPLVAIVMGSDSDFSVMEETLRQLSDFAIPFEVKVSSAHRSPHRTAEYARTARERGIQVIIAAAGWAAHLAGVIASETTLPVIGVPIESSPLRGLDSLLATVQMPGGVPVATMALGSQGARNAAVLAAQILSLSNPSLQDTLAAYKSSLNEKVCRSDAALQEKLNGR